MARAKQSSSDTTWRLAKMNLAIRSIDAQIAHGDTVHNDRHPDLRTDYVLGNGERTCAMEVHHDS